MFTWRSSNLMLTAILAVFIAGCAGTPAATAEPSDEAPETSSATASPSLAAESEAPPPELATVTIAESGRFTAFAPLYAAIELGFFDDEAIEVELVEGGGTGVQNAALINGDFDVLVALTVLGVQALLEVEEPLSFSALTSAAPIQLTVSNAWLAESGVTADSPLEDRFEALRGATVGLFSVGGGSQLVSEWVLTLQGLEPTHVEFIGTGGGAAMVAALEQGSVDAVWASPPTGPQIEDRGIGVILIDSDEIPELSEIQYQAATVLRSFAEANDDLMVRMARALARGCNLMRDDPAATAEAIQAVYFPDAEVENLTADLERLAGAVPQDCRGEESNWRNVFDPAVDLGYSEIEVDPAEGGVWTNEYIDRADLP